MGQDVFLAGQHSLRLTRAARRDPGLLLVPAPDEHLRTGQTAIDLPSLRSSLPDILLPIAPGAPLEMTFFSREARSESALVRSRCLLSRLPSASFLEVVHADGNTVGLRGGGARCACSWSLPR